MGDLRKRAASWIGTAALAAVIIVAVGMPAVALADTFEPNNTLSAAYGPLAAGPEYTSYCSAQNDVDYYWFYVGQSTTVHLTLVRPLFDGSGFWSYKTALYDEAGTWLAEAPSGFDWGDTLNLDYTLPSAGIYKIRVAPNQFTTGDYSTTDPYRLYVTGDYITKPPVTLTRPVLPLKVYRAKKAYAYGYLQPRHKA